MPRPAALPSKEKTTIYTVVLGVAAAASAIGGIVNAALPGGPPFYSAVALLATVLFVSGAAAVRSRDLGAARVAAVERSLAGVAMVLYTLLLWHAGSQPNVDASLLTVIYLWFPFVALFVFVVLRDRLALTWAAITLAAGFAVQLPGLLGAADSGRWLTALQFVLANAALLAVLYAFARFIRRLQRSEITAEAMRRLANTDVLTGLANRRRIEMLLIQELRRAQRYGRPLSVLLIDVDEFKRLNDTYGHQVGDEVLIRLAGDLRDSVRASDHLGRWGGEEFLIVTPETPLAGAVRVGESVRTHVRARSVSDGVGELGLGGVVTVSVGVAEYRDGDRLEDLVARADAALYRAKRGGRDRVRSEPPRAEVDGLARLGR